MGVHTLADKVRRPCRGADCDMSFIYAFINSEDVARHCREIGHRFTAIQSAYLIDHSYRHTLGEKHRAFLWVTEHMQDEEMLFGSEGRAAVREGRKPETLHCFLEKYMHLQNQCLDEFFDVSESCVCKCTVYESDCDRGMYEGVCESRCNCNRYEGVCESDCNRGMYESVHDPVEEYGNGRKWSEQEGNYKTAEEIRCIRNAQVVQVLAARSRRSILSMQGIPGSFGYIRGYSDSVWEMRWEFRWNSQTDAKGRRIRFGRCAHTEHITSRPEPGLMIHP